MSNLISHLSFSRLKELAHSPLALHKYITGDKIETEAMRQGTLLDCLLFEPETLNERFFVADKPDRRTNAGKAAWEEIQEKATGKMLVTTEDYNEAQYLNDCVRNNSTVVFSGLLNQVDGETGFSFQEPVKFFYNGFMHKGIKDADGRDRNGNRVIWDLKRMGARSGEMLVRSQIRNNKYDLQAAIYCHEFDIANEPIKYYIIAVDNEGYVTPFEITKDARMKARIEWNMLIKAAHRCNMEGLDAGPEFWADGNGFFQF